MTPALFTELLAVLPEEKFLNDMFSFGPEMVVLLHLLSLIHVFSHKQLNPSLAPFLIRIFYHYFKIYMCYCSPPYDSDLFLVLKGDIDSTVTPAFM